MIKLTKLSMRNFMSYGSNTTTVKLQFEKPTLIVGKNFDAAVEGQVDSNGAGKSTILNAIAFCLYGKTVSNVSADGLVNFINGKNLEVCIEFEKNNVYYKIQRYRKNKPLGGNGVRIFINEKEQSFHVEHDKTPDSVDNANAKIIDIIGVPFDIFSRIVVFSATYEPFLSLPSSHASKSNQRDIIEELFGLTELTRKAEKLKEVIKDTNADIKAVSESNARVESERNRYQEQLTSVMNKMTTWEANRKAELDDITKRLASYTSLELKEIKDIITNRDGAITAISILKAELKSATSILNSIISGNTQKPAWDATHAKQLAEVKAELDELGKIDVVGLTATAKELKETSEIFKSKTTEMQSLVKQNTNLQVNIDTYKAEIIKLHDNICPYCEQEFNNVKAKITQTELAISTIQLSIDESEEVITSLLADVDALTLRLDALKAVAIPSNLNEISTTIQRLESKYAVLLDTKNPYTIVSSTEHEEAVANTTLDIEEAEALLTSSDGELSKHPTIPSFGAWSLNVVTKIESEIVNLNLQLSKADKESNPFETTVSEIKNTLDNVLPQQNLTLYDELHDDLEHQSFLLKLLTKKDSFVRKALLNKNIPFLNTRLAHYLNIIGLKHKVLFTEEMGANILHFGTEFPYVNLSAGQAARVNIALSFAFRDVLQARFEKISFCILDECLDTGLGNVGIQLAAKMIKSIAVEDKLSMLVISHRDEIANMFDSTLEVELRHGFSNIKPSALSETAEEDDE